MKNFSDAELSAYLDGQLSAEAADEIEQAVSKDPTLETRLMALDRLAPIVSDVFVTLPGAERASALSPALITATTRSSAGWIRAAAAAVAGVAIGVATMWIYAPGDAPLLPDWRNQVAAYQVLYVAETVESIDPKPEALAGQFERAKQVLGLDLQREFLDGLAPLNLRRAQVLGFDGRPLVQVAFSSPNGSPIAFCIIRSHDAGQTQPAQPGRMAGLESTSWAGGGYEFLLIGGQDAALISTLTERLTKAFPAS